VVAHSAVHRWRYAQPARGLGAMAPQAPWWDAALGLGVCGDFLGGGRVEAAWLSGYELAQTMLLCTNPESRRA
jgi:renalase